jgi:FkbM family methyltransferase
MGLSRDDKIKRWIPAGFYYSQKIAKVTKNGEPELRILRDLVPAGCTAIDIGANRGYYSYALSKIAGRVEAFEPHPELARFARRKLGPGIPVHEVALSNREGWATLYVPQLLPGVDVHYNSSLTKIYPYEKYVEFRVPTKRLDDFEFGRVGFIKIDAEGSDMDIVEGASRTIARDRPTMIVELVAMTHADPDACIDRIKNQFDYDAHILIGGALLEAHAAIADATQALNTCNVVFTPR